MCFPTVVLLWTNMIYRHRGCFLFFFLFWQLQQCHQRKVSWLSNPGVNPFPRVSGKKSTKRTKSINGPLYVFRGRINTEVMEVENVEDGTGSCLSSSVSYNEYHSWGSSGALTYSLILLLMNHVKMPSWLSSGYFHLNFPKLGEKIMLWKRNLCS